MNDSDLAVIKQWMTEVNAFVTGMAGNTEYNGYEHHLPDDWRRRLRLMDTLVGSISVEATSLEEPYLYLCGECGHGFDVYFEKMIDYRQVEYEACCPKCKSAQFSRQGALEIQP